jgi:ketosteroid isomerase-like protein
MKLRLVGIAGLAIVFVEPAFAQQTTKCDGPQEECQQILNDNKKYDAAFERKDTAALVAMYTPDAVIVGEGPTVSGKEAITSFYDDQFKDGPVTNVTKVDEIHIAGNMAWSIGSWSGSATGPNNTTQQYRGTWGDVEVKEGGTWKTRMLTWSIIEAPPEPATNR